MAITKQQFLAGKVFKVGKKKTKATTTYKVEKSLHGDSLFIIDQTRSTRDNKVLVEQHHMNIDEITDEGFTGYAEVLGLFIDRNVKFSDLYSVE